MNSEEKSSPLRMVASAMAVLLFGSIWLYSFITPNLSRRDGAGASIKALHKEFDAVPAMGGSSVTGELFTQSKPGSNLIEQRYVTKSSPGGIISYYDIELKNQGWVYRMNYYGSSNGARAYCKNGSEAAIQVFSEITPGVLEYTFSVSSGDVAAHDCAPES